ncbi:hypothetical protein LQE85_11990 [Stenotrophomonas rhizophila]|uniref:hypothetical protein n=1 Tax=Stenotrophomonas rhizophila TaxID=216778 RepID=UPI00201CF2DF|nr:hypothetical protein [Stenotrophomonas rhizophila]UQY86224.1 hypothetical protein LQE85_11990 [Stenotrophomonas rhizophila]
MTQLPLNPGAEAADQDKARTAEKPRKDDPTWKDKDMPEAEHTATPEDYGRPAKP